MVGTEMVDWLLQQSTLVYSRNQAVGIWQALLEEGLIVHGMLDFTNKTLINQQFTSAMENNFIGKRLFSSSYSGVWAR
jgi:hypothetical protein